MKKNYFWQAFTPLDNGLTGQIGLAGQIGLPGRKGQQAVSNCPIRPMCPISPVSPLSNRPITVLLASIQAFPQNTSYEHEYTPPAAIFV